MTENGNKPTILISTLGTIAGLMSGIVYSEVVLGITMGLGIGFIFDIIYSAYFKMSNNTEVTSDDDTLG